jgi:hypothetical protein
MDKLINNINLSDCVGDSLGKINYNFLSLDMNVCNISSTFLKPPKNYNSYFLDLSSNINNFNIFADYFEYPTDFNLATTATKYLSSSWQKSEITFTFPINVYQADGNIKLYIDVNYPNDTLNVFGLNKLNSLYSAKNFPPNTIANIIFLLYSNNVGENSVTIDSFDFGIVDKVFNFVARKKDVFIKEIRISKFKVDAVSKSWTFLEYLVK